MSNPTSNFNWQMPTATDLVTDLPADFEVFGQAVDTSLADLKGGTTGQILSKNSNTDMDFVWASPNPGDITGVTAGTGISGGGTSGDVTITNSMATAIDAKGDLIAGTGADAFSRLAVGANDTVLTADSSTATGLKWATPAASGWTQLVASTSLGTGATATISSISQAYKDLRLIVTGWSSVTGGGMQISFNNTTDQYYGGFYTNYTTTWTVARTNSGRTYFRMGDDLYYLSTGDYVIDLPFYSSTNNKKLGQSYGTGLDGGSGADGGFWCNFMKANNTAISSIILSSSGGNFDAGSYELWGLK